MNKMRLGEAVRLANYSKANGLDFHRLAALADVSPGITFEKICERAENGAVTDAELLATTLRPASKDWILLHDVLDILRVCDGTWAGIICKHPTQTYWGIGAKSRSSKTQLGPGGKGARGCGALYYRADIEKLAKIKRNANLSLHCALRVFCAMKEGKF
jgi:hypothetical protein